MKKWIRNLLAACCVLCMVFSNGVVAFASESAAFYFDEKITPDGIEVSVPITVPASNNKMSRGITNWIYCAITPQAASYKITLINVGIDAIDKLTMKLTVVKDNGDFYASTSVPFSNLPVGSTVYTWNLPKGSVQETITFTATATDSGQTIVSDKYSTERWNFAGGKYGTMSALDGQRHHMPSNAVSPLSTYSGPCIRMRTADHKLTASYGGGSSTKVFQNKERELINEGKFLAAQQLGIDDVRSLFGSKYNAAIADMVVYTRSLGYEK